MRECSRECPSELERIPHPRIGHFGTVNPKLDLRLVADLVDRRPDWHWVFVGYVIEKALAADPISYIAWEKLCTRPNVHLLGSRPYGDIPCYQAQMDINVLCYRTDSGGWWEDISPLKLYEYLAVGRPVVASNLETLRSLGHVLAIATDANEWLARIEDALNGAAIGSFEQRRHVAQMNSWDVVVSELEQWILEGRPRRESVSGCVTALAVDRSG
jgi:glycosyltransferase involved in cell wall biosynthesis